MPYEEWKIDSSNRVTGNITTAVTFDGDVSNIGGLPRIGGAKVTRHHIIDIRTIQDVWNQACELEDDRVIVALCDWAACPVRQFNLLFGNKSVKPMRLIQGICWNPFNIVVGPGSTVRVGNPGEREFDYIAFVDQRDLHVAEQEFNSHLKRLRSIELYMKKYCDLEVPLSLGGSIRVLDSDTEISVDDHLYERDLAVNNATVNSLVSLLSSDKPTSYPALFTALRSRVNPAMAEVNSTNDLKRPDKASVFSLAFIPGSLIDPRLWSDDQLSSNAQFSGPPTY
jgi:hypothetical protein